MRRLRILLAALAAAAALPAAAAAADAVVGVSVATLWKAPGIARPLDAPALAAPAAPRAWNRNLATTALRLWLDAHVQTQALYGERVAVLARSGAWTKVAVLDQPDPQDAHGYPGWVPTRQLVPARGPARPASVVVTARTAWLRARGGRRLIELSFATRVPLVSAGAAAVTVLTPQGKEALLPRRAVAILPADPPQPGGAAILATARRFLGVHYLWGGLSAFGFDCSGLVWAAYRAHGIEIPRDADPQFRAGRPVPLDALRPGDLVFYGTPSSIHHVAVYAGGGRMLEAPDSAHSVRLVPLRRGELVGARRF